MGMNILIASLAIASTMNHVSGRELRRRIARMTDRSRSSLLLRCASAAWRFARFFARVFSVLTGASLIPIS